MAELGEGGRDLVHDPPVDGQGHVSHALDEDIPGAQVIMHDARVALREDQLVEIGPDGDEPSATAGSASSVMMALDDRIWGITGLGTKRAGIEPECGVPSVQTVCTWRSPPSRWT